MGTAVLEERRRIARDFHDGIAQELAFIALGLRQLGDRYGHDDTLRMTAAAADRAIDEARSAIAALTEPLDGSVAHSVGRATRDVAERLGDVRVEIVGSDFGTTAGEREALYRIAREATSNAIRHGAASSLRLRLNDGDGRSLRIVDNGGGFSTEAARMHGFGLTSMRERAASVGGRLLVRSFAGVGTAVEVRLP